MEQPQDRLLRRVLLADAVISGATGLLMAGGATLLGPLLALPEPLLRYAGLALLPFAAFVAVVATRPRIARGAVWAVIAINVLWALDSVLLLLTGWVAPSALGYGFVLFQALVVAGFAEWQWLSLRRRALQTAAA
jgi:hypothetical protein